MSDAAKAYKELLKVVDELHDTIDRAVHTNDSTLEKKDGERAKRAVKGIVEKFARVDNEKTKISDKHLRQIIKHVEDVAAGKSLSVTFVKSKDGRGVVETNSEKFFPCER